MSDDQLEWLREEYLKNFTPEIRAMEICLESNNICEREDDARRRKVADDYFNLLVNNVGDAKKGWVQDDNGLGLFIDYHNISPRDGIRILFREFVGNEKGVLGFWNEHEKEMEINTEKFPDLSTYVKEKDFAYILNHFEETICHELIHMFDYRRYRREFQPGNFKNALNNPPEFEAYYQQYARKMDKKLKTISNISDFYVTFGAHAGIFINGFWNTISKEMAELIKDSKSSTNRWNRRLFQLYHELLKSINKS